jgi:hypothetical protein
MKRKTIKKKEGKIDVSQFATIRNIDIEIDELREVIGTARKLAESNPKPVPPRARPVGEDEDKLPAPSPSLQKVPVFATDRYIWDSETPFPPLFNDIIRQIRGNYNIKDEVKGFSFMIFPPRDINHNKKHIIQKSPPKTAIRIIITVGHREKYFMNAGIGTQTGTGSLLQLKDQSFSIPIGVAAGLECSFDDSGSFMLDPKPGFRDGRRMSKDPTSVYIIVIDGAVDPIILINTIKKQADKAAKGNAEISKLLCSGIVDSLETSEEVNMVVQEAVLTQHVEPPEVIIPEVGNGVEMVVNEANESRHVEEPSVKQIASVAADIDIVVEEILK